MKTENCPQEIQGFNNFPVAATANGASKNLPEFIRLPKVGQRCPLTGLSRTGLNELILPCSANNFRPPVRSVCLRKRGAATGTRLISTDSLLEYLHSLADQHIQEAA